MVAVGRAGGEGRGREREQDAEHEEEAHRRPSTRARGGGFGGTLLRITTARCPAPTPSSAASARSRPVTGVRSSGSGRRAGTSVTLRVGDRDHALADAGFGVLEATVEAAPGEDYAFVVERHRVPRSRHALAAARPARALAAARRDRVRVERRRLPGALARGVGHLRAARRHVHGGGHVRRRDRAPARPARARDHDDRADARGRLPRPPRLGLRRRLHQRRARPLRRPGGPAAVRRRRPPRGPGGPARRRLQPRRRVRHAGPGVLRPLLHLALRDAVGPGDELRRRRLRRRPRVGAAERRAVDPRLPPRRAAPRRDPLDPRLQPRAPGRRDQPPRARG